MIFDLGIGDIFSVRVAGNVINDDILGSLEFATNIVGSNHILVLGHTNCGAVRGALEDVELGHLTGLLAKIKTAILNAKERGNEELNYVAKINVENTINELTSQSPILEDLVKKGLLSVSGGLYEVNSGKVQFFD